MKQLVQNPWTTAADRYPANSAVTGKVTRIADFGAFVELEPGLEGLDSRQRARPQASPSSVGRAQSPSSGHCPGARSRSGAKTGQPVAQGADRPTGRKEGRRRAAPEPIQRKRKGPLKGGTGSSGPSGLFGNPSDLHLICRPIEPSRAAYRAASAACAARAVARRRSQRSARSRPKSARLYPCRLS